MNDTLLPNLDGDVQTPLEKLVTDRNVAAYAAYLCKFAVNTSEELRKKRYTDGLADHDRPRDVILAIFGVSYLLMTNGGISVEFFSVLCFLQFLVIMYAIADVITLYITGYHIHRIHEYRMSLSRYLQTYVYADIKKYAKRLLIHHGRTLTNNELLILMGNHRKCLDFTPWNTMQDFVLPQ